MRLCKSCRRTLSVAAFYSSGTECKECKRGRSKRNRMLQARKLAAFERFVDVLVDIADKTMERPNGREAEVA